jgi:hypothetical protein
MAETASRIPTELRAGDTARWRRSLASYPASAGWVLAYQLVASDGVRSLTAAASGDEHLIEVTAADTAAWSPGVYTVQEYVTRSGERFTTGTFRLRVLPNLAANTAGADLRTHARKVLDAIEGWLESKAPVTGAFEIAGRKVENYPLPELLALRDKYRVEVAREEAAAGGRIGRKLMVRF